MIERGEHACLALESHAPVLAGEKRCRQHLEGDVATEPTIVRPIDLAHSASADHRTDLVGADPDTDRKPCHPVVPADSPIVRDEPSRDSTCSTIAPATSRPVACCNPSHPGMPLTSST